MSFIDWLYSQPRDFIMFCYFGGAILLTFYDIISSLSTYLIEKANRVNDLEKIIAMNLKPYDVDSNFEKKIIAECSDNNERYLNAKKKRTNFINKIKSLFRR